MTDPMPRKDVELPPRMPEAAIIAELRAENDRLRADAQAAVALVVEKAAEAVPQGWCAETTKHKEMDVDLGLAIQATIRALAPDAGTAELALREQAAWEAGRKAGVLEGMGYHKKERDTLAAAQAQIEALRGAAISLRFVAVMEIPELEQCREVIDLDAALATLPAKEGE